MNPEPITANADRIVGLSNRALFEFGNARISHVEFRTIAELYKQAKNNLQKIADTMQNILDNAAEQHTIECKANATQTNKDNENDRPINQLVSGIT